jgi:hypothetical protein
MIPPSVEIRRCVAGDGQNIKILNTYCQSEIEYISMGDKKARSRRASMLAALN